MEKKVLVVDDDPDICELIQVALSTKGYVVKVVQTGTEGIENAGTFLPDLILLDMTLPDMEGTEVAKKIKGMETGKKAPILLMSGRGLVRSEVDSTLFAGVLNKPFSLTDLAREADKYASDYR